MKKGDFVTAELTEREEYERQGIFLSDEDDGTIVIMAEFGNLYTCLKHSAVVVPDENLTGKTREFVMSFRLRDQT